MEVTMTIWRVGSDIHMGPYLVVKDVRDFAVFKNDSNELLEPKWHPVEIEDDPNSHLAPPNPEISNFPGLSPSTHVWDQKAVDILRPLVSVSVEILPLVYRTARYYYIRVLQLQNCFDADRAEFFNSGERLRKVTKFAFKDDCLGGRHIFRLPETGSQVYVSDTFKQKVEQSDLKGYTFKEIPQ